MTEQISADVAECIKSVSHIGSDTYVNVCTGESFNVAWGSGDWGVGIFLGLIFTIMLGLLGGLIYAVIKEI